VDEARLVTASFMCAAHIVGLYAPVDTKPPLPRSFGVIGTWLTMLVLAGWCMLLAVQA
jgi:hypothetical protein